MAAHFHLFLPFIRQLIPLRRWVLQEPLTPEDFKEEWNRIGGYPNLVDFEKEAGCLARGILLFSECDGALAELGAFCTDDVLCERLVVVLEDKHYDDDSPDAS